MATPFNEQRLLDCARAPGSLEQLGATTHFDEEGFPLGEAHVRPVDRAHGVLAALVKHPRWVDRDM